MSRRDWQREELILAFNLYCKIPFGQIHNRNPSIIALASIIERSPSAVSWKLANFSRLDPALQERNIVGATHGSKGEVAIWEEFNNDWTALAFESERLLAQKTGRAVEEDAGISEKSLPREGKERERVVRIRVNQGFFRKTILAAYGARCCITGLAVPELLTASHIVPWAVDHENRVNPHNGLCLNALHDRAFDCGLVTITPEYRVELSSSLKAAPENEAVESFFARYDGEKIRLPERFAPEVALLKRHNEEVFVGK